jgi:hypothetical protein
MQGSTPQPAAIAMIIVLLARPLACTVAAVSPSSGHRISATVAIFRFPSISDPLGAGMERQVKYVPQESEMPRQWDNIVADLPLHSEMYQR